MEYFGVVLAVCFASSGVLGGGNPDYKVLFQDAAVTELNEDYLDKKTTYLEVGDDGETVDGNLGVKKAWIDAKTCMEYFMKVKSATGSWATPVHVSMCPFIGEMSKGAPMIKMIDDAMDVNILDGENSGCNELANHTITGVKADYGALPDHAEKAEVKIVAVVQRAGGMVPEKIVTLEITGMLVEP